MIDATIVRAHQHSAGARKKRRTGDRPLARRGRPPKSTPWSMRSGNPVEVMLTPGQAHDLTCAEPLLEFVDPGAVLGDKAFDADPFIDALERRDIAPVIR